MPVQWHVRETNFKLANHKFQITSALLTSTNYGFIIYTSTPLILLLQDDSVNNGAPTRDTHLELTRWQMTDYFYITDTLTPG